MKVNKYKVKIVISHSETPLRVYYVKAEYLQEAINLCLYDVAQKYNIAHVYALILDDNYLGEINCLYIYNDKGKLEQKVELSDDFYNT